MSDLQPFGPIILIAAAFIIQAVTEKSFGPELISERKFRSSEYLSMPPVQIYAPQRSRADILFPGCIVLYIESEA